MRANAVCQPILQPFSEELQISVSERTDLVTMLEVNQDFIKFLMVMHVSPN